MKTRYNTCVPASYLTLNAEERALAEADGLAPGAPTRWCNAHVCVLGTKECQRSEIVLDDEHPMYGTLGTICYPQDRYPVVVVGGAASGKYLIVAPINEHAVETLAGYDGPWPVHDRSFTREEALEHMLPQRAFRINRKKDGSYSSYVRLGSAHYHRNYSY